MRYKGRITNWNDDRGFGFVTPATGGVQVFVHIKSFVNRQRRPVGSEIVTYELKRDPKGRLQGVNVAYPGERNRSARRSRGRAGSLILTSLFIAFLAGSVIAGLVPVVVLGAYVFVSGLTYIAYAWDKSAAKRNRRRTPESTLLLLGLLGGWPGGLAAQSALRHKSRKISFQRIFWTTVAINVAGLVWFVLNAAHFAL